MYPRQSSNKLPGWLWFFLVLPMVLVVALLYKRQRLPARLQQQIRHQLDRVAPPRYTEPDSIPLDMSDVHPAAVPDVAAALAETPASESASAGEVEAVEDEARERAGRPEGDTTDDLKVIEGIGPAIAGLLQRNDIRTYADLAETPVDRLQEILTAARLNRISDPSTWPEQARLAAEGRWDALDELQRTLKGGRRR